MYGDTPNLLPLEELATRWEIARDHVFWDGIDESMTIDQSKHSLFGASKAAADVLVCSVEPDQAEAAGGVARLIRDAGTRTVLDVAERRLDRKLRGAERIGARVAVIIGENEVAGGSAVVRDLDGHSQQTVPMAELADTVMRILGGTS